MSAQQDEAHAFWDRLIEAHGVPTCAVCHRTEWRIGPAAALPILDGGILRDLGGPRILALQVVCQVCRHTLFFTGQIVSTEDADVLPTESA